MNDVLGKLNQLQVKGDLFQDVKYYVTGNLEPEVCECFFACYLFMLCIIWTVFLGYFEENIYIYNTLGKWSGILL